MLKFKNGEAVDEIVEVGIIRDYIEALNEELNNIYTVESREIRTNGHLEYFVFEIKKEDLK